MAEKQLAHYVLTERLGVGGMGEVHRARDSKLEREVAIKVLREDAVQDAERLQRFKQEALATSALNHPNITTIYEVGDAEGQTYICLEYIDGKTLRDQLAQGPMEMTRVLEIGAQLAEGLAAAHQAGIVHRDLKPDNVMIRPDGIVKILDFGLAKLTQNTVLDTDETMTQAGMVVGTVAYMSPEQARGQAIDHRSDIFSFGSLLYEMAGGQKPFVADSTIEVMNSIIREAPKPLQEISEEAPLELTRIIRKAMAKNPEERYQSAKDISIDLRNLKREYESGGSVLTATHAAAPPAKRRVWPWLALVVVGLAATFWFLRPTGQQSVPTGPIQMSRITNSGSAESPVWSPDGRFLAYELNRRGRDSIWLRQMATNSDVELVPEGMDELKGNKAFTPDGNWLLYTTRARTDRSRTLMQVSPLGGEPRVVLENIDSEPSFIAGTNEFVFLRIGAGPQSTFYKTHLESREPARQIFEQPPEALIALSPKVSPDGQKVLFTQINKDAVIEPKLMLLDVQKGTTEDVSVYRWLTLTGYDWAPDGNGFFLSGGRSWIESPQVWYVDLASKRIESVTNDLNQYSSVAVRPDGRGLAVIRHEIDSHLYFVPLNGTPLENSGGTRRLTTGTDFSGGPQVSPDATRVAFASDASGEMDLWVMDIDGGNRRQLTFDERQDFMPRWSPDGRYIAYGSEHAGDLQIWIMDADGKNPRRLTRSGTNYSHTWSPDSRSLAYLTQEGEKSFIEVLGIDGGEARRVSETPAHVVVDWSSDGRWIASWSRSDQSPLSPFKATLYPANGQGEPQVLDLEANDRLVLLSLAWGKDAQSLGIMERVDGVSNLKRVPLEIQDGRTTVAPSSALTQFQNDDIIFMWSWSPNNDFLIMQRGTESADVVLLEPLPDF